MTVCTVVTHRQLTEEIHDGIDNEELVRAVIDKAESQLDRLYDWASLAVVTEFMSTYRIARSVKRSHCCSELHARAQRMLSRTIPLSTPYRSAMDLTRSGRKVPLQCVSFQAS